MWALDCSRVLRWLLLSSVATAAAELQTQARMFNSELRSTFASWLERAIISPLRSTRALRQQLALLLYFAKIDKLVRICYERRLVASRGQAEGLSSFHQRQSFSSSAIRLTKRHAESRPSRAVPRVAEFPTVPAVFKRYEIFSICYMSLCLIKYGFPRQINGLVGGIFGAPSDGQIAGMPVECLVPGRIVIIPVVRNLTGFLVNGLNLAYRACVWYARRRYCFYAIDLLIQSESDVEEFYESFETRRTDTMIERHPFVKFMCHQNIEYQGERDAVKIGNQRRDRPSCYRLRSNMRADVIEGLKRRVARATIASALIFADLAVIFVTLSGIFIILDWGYAYRYSGCDEQLDHLFATDQLALLSVTLTPHRCLMIFFDALENFVTWFSWSTIIVHVYSLLYLLNYHVECQWKSLHKETQLALQRAQLSHHSTGAPKIGLSPVGKRELVDVGRESILAGERAALAELQAEMCDLFKQISLVDVYAGHILTLCIAAWLISLFVVLNDGFDHYFADPSYSPFGIPFEIWIFVGAPVALVPASIICFILFRTHTGCLKTYNLLWSLLASHAEPRRQRQKFANEIIEYYVRQRSTCYKIFGTVPFKATTYLSLVGWTISGLAILINIVPRDIERGSRWMTGGSRG